MDLDRGVGEKTQAFEMRRYHRLLNISYKDHVINKQGPRKIQAAIGEYDELLTLVKKWKLRWFWLSKDDATGHSQRKEKKR